MKNDRSVVTPERFASGMTFTQYLAFIGTPANLAREGTRGERRRDLTAQMHAWYEASRLTDAQASAIKWLASQPGGPAQILVISEAWSSDCRRDVPMFARLAEAGNLELRIFPRDGKTFGPSQPPSLAEAAGSHTHIIGQVLD